MEIRSVRKSDLQRILVINEEWIPHVSQVGIKDLEWFMEHADLFKVLEMGDDVIGFMIVLQKDKDYDSLNYQFFCNSYADFEYVDRIAIDKKYLGNGYGKQLYTYLFDQSDKKMVCCEVNLKPPNPRSMQFHKSLGFSEVAKMRTNGGEKEVSMLVKNL